MLIVRLDGGVPSQAITMSAPTPLGAESGSVGGVRRPTRQTMALIGHGPIRPLLIPHRWPLRDRTYGYGNPHANSVVV